MTSLWTGLMVVGLSLFSPADSFQPASPCAEKCYEAKSMAYQRCRTISPGNRSARVKCFQDADNALQGCLRSCR